MRKKVVEEKKTPNEKDRKSRKRQFTRVKETERGKK